MTEILLNNFGTEFCEVRCRLYGQICPPYITSPGPGISCPPATEPASWILEYQYDDSLIEAKPYVTNLAVKLWNLDASITVPQHNKCSEFTGTRSPRKEKRHGCRAWFHAPRSGWQPGFPKCCLMQCHWKVEKSNGAMFLFCCIFLYESRLHIGGWKDGLRVSALQ